MRNNSPSEQNPYMICLIPPQSLRRKFMRVAAYAPEHSVAQPEADLHITLTSLQMPKKKSAADLLERLKQVKFPAFDIRITDVDTFNRPPEPHGRSKAAWFRPDGVSSNEIQELNNQILSILRPAGYPVGQADIRPHMTVLRYDFYAGASAIRGFLEKCAEHNYPDWTVDRFYLTRKRPQGEGAEEGGSDEDGKFEIVASFPLLRP